MNGISEFFLRARRRLRRAPPERSRLRYDPLDRQQAESMGVYLYILKLVSLILAIVFGTALLLMWVIEGMSFFAIARNIGVIVAIVLIFVFLTRLLRRL